MCLAISIQIHHNITGLSALLTGIGQTSRIQNHDPRILLQAGPVGMSEHHNIKASGP